MKTTSVMVTPAMAEQWLECNRSNRKLRAAWVSQLAGMITRGEWQHTHQGIALDKDGNLLDGQHRLSAIVLSGIAVQMQVTTGMGADTFAVLDRGRTRSLVDITGDSNIYIAVLGILWRINEGFSISNNIAPTADQYWAAKEWAHDCLDSALRCAHGASRKKLIPAPVITGAVIRHMMGQDVTDQLRAMGYMDFGAMTGSVQALCRQILANTANSAGRADLLARAFRAFDPENPGNSKIIIRDVDVVIGEIREAVVGYAARKIASKAAA